MLQVSQPTNTRTLIDEISRCDSYNTARLQIISAPEDVELDEPENDIPAPELVMESEETVPETPATTELSIAPRVVDQRPEGQFSPTYTESSAVPMNIDTTDTGDSEEDEVEFWGGTSPRERALLQEAMRAEKGEAESDSDESMSDEDVEIMDDDEDDDEMAIFGHR